MRKQHNQWHEILKRKYNGGINVGRGKNHIWKKTLFMSRSGHWTDLTIWIELSLNTEITIIKHAIPWDEEAI